MLLSARPAAGQCGSVTVDTDCVANDLVQVAEGAGGTGLAQAAAGLPGTAAAAATSEEEAQAAAAEAAARALLKDVAQPPVMAKIADFGLSARMGEGQTHASNCWQVRVGAFRGDLVAAFGASE